MEFNFLQPIIALVLWTFVIWFLLYTTRLPAVKKVKPDFSKIKNGQMLRQVLPEKINWIADNYNHLHEQPVLFYAVAVVA